ncbi:hypothetical protein HPC49_50485 [Pyxidicoccus fallax]|uniref:Uncharacterized protein n=1 Tax=Pyxidicoccus fallax TaxID=394095 RepID=A0A848M1U4_9BACT|nr:hypothetical protein [Pyxidicoccus fallax]NMO23324.1 hypothetical protein [Pyxidicoccus fallax]NPC86403.1 hypothetical protein [Pyxidicoccus fallax]
MSSTFMKQALWVPLATLALGVASGLAVGRAAPPPPASGNEELLRLLEGQRALLEALPARLAAEAGARQVQCAVDTPSGASTELAALRTELASLREELALGHGARTRPPEPPPEPSPQAIAARQQGLQVIEAASRSGEWKTEDAQALREQLADMGDDQRQEVMRRLIVLLNEGKLKRRTQGPLF